MGMEGGKGNYKKKWREETKGKDKEYEKREKDCKKEERTKREGMREGEYDEIPGRER